MADGEGFEPSVPCGTHAFQACPIDRSGTHPKRAYDSGVDSSVLQPLCNAGRGFDPRSKRCVDRIGGEPQWKCAAVEFGKGLLRDSLKDLFAAAPVGVATSTILSTQRVETCLHPQGVASIRTPDLPRPLAPRCVGATTRNATPLRSGPANQSLLTSHLRRLRRQPFGDRLQLCLELSLTLVEHIQLQLVTVKLDQSVVYLTSDFGRLGLNFLALAF